MMIVMIVENLDVHLQIFFIEKIDNRLHNVSLTSIMKRAHKRKGGLDSATRNFAKMDLVAKL